MAAKAEAYPPKYKIIYPLFKEILICHNVVCGKAAPSGEVTIMKITVPRTKLSTTVSRATHQYLRSLVKSGRASTIAEAVDLVAERVQRLETRARLERDTAAYFAGSPAAAQKDEAQLEQALSDSVDEVSFEE